MRQTRCTSCGETGHNRRTCTRPGAGAGLPRHKARMLYEAEDRAERIAIQDEVDSTVNEALSRVALTTPGRRASALSWLHVTLFDCNTHEFLPTLARERLQVVRGLVLASAVQSLRVWGKQDPDRQSKELCRVMIERIDQHRRVE